MVPQNPSLGDSIEIVCTIKRGSLPVTFSWLHNGQVISVEKQKKVMLNERSSHFSIGHIQSSDIGNYTCVVSNRYGEDRKTASVIIEVHDNRKQPMLNPVMVPHNLSMGDIAEIFCSLRRGEFPVSFRWLHNGKDVSHQSKYKITTGESSSTFHIGKIQAIDIGNYTCVATNRYGKDEMTSNLLIESLCDDPPVLNPMYIPPNLAIGDNIELSCIVKRGSSPIQIDWQHNAKKISSLQKRKIINYESSSHLSIGKIQPDDVGNYTCVAKNNIGQDSNTVILMIEGDHQPPVLTPMFVPPNLAINDITDIHCNIKRGSFPVSFSWFHNDVEITGMNNYKITNTETSSHLSIGKIQASDIGNYTCKATNRFGHDTGTVSVLIEEVKAEEPVLNPVLISPNLSLGDHAELLCTLKRGSLPLTFKWLHNEVDVTEKKKNDIVMSKRSTHLSIGEIQASDIGNYTCVVNNRMGEDRTSVQVLIEVSSIEEPPVLNPLVIPPNLAIGDMTGLSCTVKRGSLPIVFNWYHNSKIINEHQKYKISNSQISSHFLIGKISATDIGNYTCKASNTYGEDSKTESVIIEGETAEDKPVLNPLVTPPNLAIGDITELSCTMKRGSLPISFKWFHNDVEIRVHHKYKISSTKTSSHLSLGEIQAADIGNYTCKAINAYGYDSKIESVIIEGAWASEEQPALYPLLVPQNPSLGDSIEMLCTIKRGSLPVIFSWLHNGEVISTEKQKKINERSSHFSISHIQANDIGNYTCIASNKYGKDSKTASVVIEGSSDEQPVLNPMYVPPNLSIGDNIELYCIVKRGSYPVQIQWLHNDKKVTSMQKYKIINSESSSHLSIGKIQPEDIGNYTCVAKNRFGQDSNTVTLIIEDGNTEEPVLNPLLIPPNLSLGDNIELLCTLKRGSLPLSFKWLHNGKDVTEKMRDKIITSKMSTHLSIGKIQATDIGNYTCVVRNNVGEDRCTLQVIIDVCGEEQSPVLNPMFIPPNLAIGDMTELTCTVKRGNLPITFTWFHNNQIISNHHKYKISNSKISTQFLIEKVTPSDIGNYTCKASNAYGEDSKTESVIIEGETSEDMPILNPMFTPPSLALGDITELTCTVKRGTSPISFKWYHNDIEIRSHPKYKITSGRASTQLFIGEIQATDIGNYTCKAINTYGQDSKTESVIIEGVSANEPPVLNPMMIPPNLSIGDIAEISCSVKRGSFPVTFKWYHNGAEITSHYKYKASNSKSSSYFTIGEIEATDIGNYTCVSSNQYGEDSKTQNLLIEVEMSDAPVLNPLLIPPSLALGDITEIACSVKRGSLPVTFKWLQNGLDVSDHSKYKMSSTGSSSHFFIGKIHATDIGNYTCIVKNAYGQDEKTISLIIEGIATENAPVLNPLLIPPNLSLGDITDILCTVKKGSFPMTYKWLLNDKEITSHMKYKITTIGSSSHLSIGKIEAVDIGNYTCVVSNTYGQDKGSVQVILEASKSIDPPVLFPLMVPSNPSIGDNTEMLCTLKRGSLPVSFIWLYNNRDVTLISKYKIISTDKSSHFSIGNIQPHDIGNYTCVATNSAGTDRQTTSIVIEAASEISSEPPVLYPLMVPSNPTLGDDTDILCKLRRGSQPVKFEWYHNGNKIAVGSKVKITTLDRRSVFSMGNIQVTDIGNYTCVASNDFGRDSKTESVLIEGHQSEPPTLHPLSIPPDLNLGDSLDIICSLKRGSLPVIFEWKVNGQTPTKRIGIQINTSNKRSVYIIDKISAADVGNYTCIASNEDGTDKVYATLDVEVNNVGVPILHPLFIPPDLGLGDSLDITCSLKRGNPPIVFAWKLNGKDIKLFSGIRINTSERRSVCVIQNINHEHIGNYTCKASNSEGYDEAYTELKVEATLSEKPDLYPMFVPPNIGLGDPVDLHCSIRKGSLPVTFTWFQNNKVITNSSKQNVKITNNPRKSDLNIESLSSESIGNYTCQAVNNIGSDDESILVYAEVPPHWTKEPMDTTAAKGAGLIVDCTATGHPTPRVSWNRQKG
ncbi:titin [Trichonephila inaurata madagascariensis]|uniref:Titin n=1 Tax=Trichonephila inaurata madagascariensis TaxID=2747483 RepID=A0A8X6MCB4_9ARAC|nr:titin [Trichonephila inaurata madagascariensis]